MHPFTPENIRLLRRHLGMSQVEFGERIGVSWITVSRWENGHNHPDPLAERALGSLLWGVQNGAEPATQVMVSLTAMQLAAVLEALQTGDHRLDEAKETEISAAIAIFQVALDQITQRRLHRRRRTSAFSLINGNETRT